MPLTVRGVIVKRKRLVTTTTQPPSVRPCKVAEWVAPSAESQRG